ncbi:hypothetical protein G9A89_011992 [Geosiphon pyriformis]|nr:hypothetical protein G9A89_011992 [Geosiphon pyriformis]
MGLKMSKLRRRGRRNIRTSVDFVLNEQEIDRLQVNHHLSKTMWGSNFAAPIEDLLKKGARVLDVGCGPGTWLFDMASDFPQSQYFGVEISSIFPDITPFNVKIIKADVLKKLPFKDNDFDYVFVRHLVPFFTSEQWATKVIPELMRVLKPGGWIELIDAEYMFSQPGPLLNKLGQNVLNLFRDSNLDPMFANKLPAIMKETNRFPRISHDQTVCRLGASGGWLGGMIARNAFTSLLNDHIAFKLLKRKDYQQTLAELIAEANGGSSTITYHRIFAEKS